MLDRDTLPFLRAWLSAPLRIASVAPSSRSLARLITSEIDASTCPVLELGPGTGVFTHALLARGVPEEQLILVESDQQFAQQLSLRFPRAQVLCMDATRLNKLALEHAAVASNLLGAVISGLPILSMPPKNVLKILHGAFRHLRNNGVLYQFTYGPRCPVSERTLECLGLKAERLGGTLANLPPANVYRITRRNQE